MRGGPKMGKTKKHYTPEFKLKVVLEVLKGEKTAIQLAGELGAHPVVLSEWKKELKAFAFTCVSLIP